MKESELIYTILELEEWCSKGARCSFCTTLYSDEDIAVCQIRTRNKLTDKIIENDRACERCKEKFENEELPKCENCGRLKTKININFRSGKYICNCVRNKEDNEEKELPILPIERRQTAFYERQINTLQEKERELTEEVDVHLEALETSKIWSDKKIERIKELEAEVSKLSQENKQLREQNRIELYEKEITELKTQLEQLTSQIETPPKENKIKNFFKFGLK